MVRLDSKPIFDCKIDVQTKKLFGVAVPGTWSFAMSVLPAGQRVAVPHDLGELIVKASRRPIRRRGRRTRRGFRPSACDHDRGAGEGGGAGQERAKDGDSATATADGVRDGYSMSERAVQALKKTASTF